MVLRLRRSNSTPARTPTVDDESRPMPLDSTALSSLSASLEDLTNRLGQLAGAGGDDDEDRNELLEVERQLQTAGRRLEKIVRRASRAR